MREQKQKQDTDRAAKPTPTKGRYEGCVLLLELGYYANEA
jgi:hypothetical protein